MRLLSNVNLEHKKYDLKRVNVKQLTGMSAVIGNFRRYLVELGYNCSLFLDTEILAFEELIFNAEQSNDGLDCLKEVLDFLCVKGDI